MHERSGADVRRERPYSAKEIADGEFTRKGKIEWKADCDAPRQRINGNLQLPGALSGNELGYRREKE
jgi:hypothetical protein